MQTEHFQLPDWQFTSDAVQLRRYASQELTAGNGFDDEVKRVHGQLKFGARTGLAVGVLGTAMYAESDATLGRAGYAYAYESGTGPDFKLVLGGICVERFLRGNGISAMLAREVLTACDPEQEVDNANNAVTVLLGHGFEEVDGMGTSSPPAEIRPDSLRVSDILAALPQAFPNLQAVEYSP